MTFGDSGYFIIPTIMDYTGTLAVLSQLKQRKVLLRKRQQQDMAVSQALEAVAITNRALAKIPQPTPQEQDLCVAQEDLAFHQLLLDLNVAVFENLRVGDEVWLRSIGNVFRLTTVVALDDQDRHVVRYAKFADHISRWQYARYPTPLKFRNLVFLPTKIGTYTVEQTKTIYLNLSTILNQLVQFI